MPNLLVAVSDSVFPTLDPARRVLSKLGAELRLAADSTPEAILQVARGADALLVQATAPLDYLLLAGLRAKQATGLPMVAVPTSFPDEPATTFWNAGFDVVVRSHQLLQAAVAAQAAVLGPLLDGSVRPRDLPVPLTDHAHLNVRRL